MPRKPTGNMYSENANFAQVEVDWEIPPTDDLPARSLDQVAPTESHNCCTEQSYLLLFLIVTLVSYVAPEL